MYTKETILEPTEQLAERQKPRTASITPDFCTSPHLLTVTKTHFISKTMKMFLSELSLEDYTVIFLLIKLQLRTERNLPVLFYITVKKCAPDILL